LEELFPTNSPELGTGANAAELGGAAELRGRWSLGEGKNEDILGAVTYGKTAGEAEIAGSQVELRPCNIAKKMNIDKAAQNLVRVAMDS
jgi:3-oxoacyl-ACP reductase-like protein